MGSVYNYVTSHAPDSMTFMNYGYSPPGDVPVLELDPDDEPNRLGIQLYNAVVAQSDLTGKDVLEIGCGRGGGSNFMAKYLQPRTVVGLDLASKAISFCQRRYNTRGLSFKAGDAANLPFAASTFDVVVNVESCHGYPDVDGFLREAWRVLRPGGTLLLADFRPRDHVSSLRKQIQSAGFSITDEEPITTSVVAALDQQSDRTKAMIDSYVSGPVRRFLPNCVAGLRDASAIRGTDQFAKLASGELEYVRFVARKASPSG